MQTFLPYESFTLSANVLDYRRLGKQRVEAYQILKTLKLGGGWSNHPAVKMWRGYEDALGLYMNTMISEWIMRGYRNNMGFYIASTNNIVMPPWLGDDRFHKSHQSNLIRKLSSYYRQHFITLK